MEETPRKEEMYPKLLHLIPNEHERKPITGQQITASNSKLLDEEERDLELRLGLPGRDDDQEEKFEEKPCIQSLNYNYSLHCSKSVSHGGAKRGFSDAMIKSKSQVYNARMGKELSLGKGAEKGKNTHQCQDAGAIKKPLAATAQTRNVTAPVVGWPPVRSFRKNIASSSSKQLPEPQNQVGINLTAATGRKGNFVKINMDGIPIGRKVDLTAYDSYDELCLAVKDLFKGLLEVQKDSSGGKDGECRGNVDDRMFSCLLDGSGEYTLVYEDSEGDQVLASDVPWRLFVSSAKRLRVLKSSELARLPAGSISRKRPTHC